MTSPATRAWRCTVCGYVHVGDEPPEYCPICTAPPELFEPYVEEACAAAAAAAQADAGSARRVVVVGAGIAGVSAAESARTAASAAQITLVSRESELPYYRLNLTRYLAGEIGREALPLHPEGWYAANGIELVRGTEATAIDLEHRRVALEGAGGSRALEFDKLILASGAHPFVPPFPGAELEGVMTLRTLSDADRLLEAARRGRSCVCIGGGILGLETAAALARQGARAALLESHPWLMPRQLNRRGGEILRAHVERLGIDLRIQARTKEIAGARAVEAVRLLDGPALPAGLVVLTTGIRSDARLAREAGLTVKNGIVVDNYLGASAPGVFAVGDAAEHQGVVYGTWAPAQYQGSIAGLNAAGRATVFGGIPRAHTLKVLGIDLVSLGKLEPEDGSYSTLEEETDGAYAYFMFRDDRLVGSILLGAPVAAVAGAAKKAIEDKRDFSAILRRRPSAGDFVEHLRAG